METCILLTPRNRNYSCFSFAKRCNGKAAIDAAAGQFKVKVTRINNYLQFILSLTFLNLNVNSFIPN